MKIIKHTEEKNIKEIINYINSNNINICQDHLIQTIALDTLSTYLKQDQKNIKKLEKSKENTPKWYKI